MRSIVYLALTIYFKNLFTIVVKKILKDKIKDLVVIKELINK